MIAGVDEVGRGALFGPVVAAAVILLRIRAFAGCATPSNFFARTASAWPRSSSARRCHRDRRSRCGDHRPRQHLPGDPHRHGGCGRPTVARPRPSTDRCHAPRSRLRADQHHLRRLAVRFRSPPHRSSPRSIAMPVCANSTVEYPQYGLASHKGYSTPQHLAALEKHGPCPLHRKSFRPVAQTSLPWDVPSSADHSPAEDTTCPSASFA